MNWLFQHLNLNLPPINEPKIDCLSCQVHPSLTQIGHYESETKCCQFSPFWSCFGVGAWLGENPDQSLKAMEDQGLLITVLGVLHPMEHRLEKKSLCHHFKNQSCSIWQERPPICFGFYCTSQHKEGLSVYGKLEKWLLQMEASLVRKWFEHLKIEEEIWGQWTEYMEARPRIKSLPKELIVNDLVEAHRIYRESIEYLKSPILKSFLNEQGELYEKSLARHPLLC